MFAPKDGVYRARCISSKYFVKSYKFQAVFKLQNGKYFDRTYHKGLAWLVQRDLKTIGLAPPDWSDVDGWLETCIFFKDREFDVYHSYDVQKRMSQWRFL